MTFRLVGGDAIQAMQAMAENSVDAIVTDPPYGLEFMGKEWDRITYAGGNPSMKVGERPIAERGEGWQPGSSYGARQKNPRCRRCGKLQRGNGSCKCPTADWSYRGDEGGFQMQGWHHAWATEALRILKPGGHLLAFGGSRTIHRLICAVEDAGFEIRDMLAWLYGSGFPKSLQVGEGFGTALKPAWEGITLARKPLSERNVAANVQRWGTGALNIDGCRIEGDVPTTTHGVTNGEHIHQLQGRPLSEFTPNTAGRWPANVTLDETAAAMLDEQTGELPGGGFPAVRSPDAGRTAYGEFAGQAGLTATRNESGGASRFFYCPKADREERNRGLGHMAPLPVKSYGGAEISGRTQVEGEWQNTDAPRLPRANTHPTVKPVELMRWLCRMVTPKGGTVLDPFAGSGSTGVAAMREGFEFIGIEREADYVEIARARIIGDSPLFNVEVGVPTE